MSTELEVIKKEVGQLRQMVNQEKASRLNDSLFSKELAPHYMKLAAELSKSAMVPKAYQGKPQDLFVAMAMGYQIGLSVEQSIQAIAVINGRPCLWGDDMLGLCMAHPEFEDMVEEAILDNDKIIGYKCTVIRKGMSPCVKTFTYDMAKKAGLLSKPGPWTQYPERMLQLRARAFALRDKFPDALKGIKSREEVEDYIDVEFKVVDDKSSRTEYLKKLLTERENHVETTNETNNSIPTMASDGDPKATSESSIPEELVAPGAKEIVISESDIQLSKINAEQIAIIKKLLDEKGFTEERKAKALKYYEVDSIESLTNELANHFINKLNKS